MIHAAVQHGQIHMLRSGRFVPVSRWDAVVEVLSLQDSPYPSSQERARQIRAALTNPQSKENHHGNAH